MRGCIAVVAAVTACSGRSADPGATSDKAAPTTAAPTAAPSADPGEPTDFYPDDDPAVMHWSEGGRFLAVDREGDHLDVWATDPLAKAWSFPGHLPMSMFVGDDHIVLRTESAVEIHDTKTGALESRVAAATDPSDQDLADYPWHVLVKSGFVVYSAFESGHTIINVAKVGDLTATRRLGPWNDARLGDATPDERAVLVTTGSTATNTKQTLLIDLATGKILGRVPLPASAPPKPRRCKGNNVRDALVAPDGHRVAWGAHQVVHIGEIADVCK